MPTVSPTLDTNLPRGGKPPSAAETAKARKHFGLPSTPTSTTTPKSPVATEAKKLRSAVDIAREKQGMSPASTSSTSSSGGAGGAGGAGGSKPFYYSDKNDLRRKKRRKK